MSHAIMPPKTDAMSRMQQWLKRGGCRFPEVEIKTSAGEHRGLYCRSDVRKGNQVLEIRRRFMMCGDRASQSPIGQEIVKSGITPALKQSTLAAFILVELHRPDSFWAPYLATLPKSFDEVPLFFDKERLADLNGSYILDWVQTRRDAIEQDHALLKTSVPRFVFSLAEFSWAMTAINTRAFAVPSRRGGVVPAMIPFLDMGNHSETAVTRWVYQEDRAAMVLNVTDAVRAGQQLYLHYGAKSKARFFAGYGFIPDGIEEDQTRITVSLPLVDPHYFTKRGLFQGEETRTFTLSSKNFDGLAETLDAIHVTLANPKTEREYDALLGRKFTNIDHERMALHITAALCDDKLASFTRELSENEARLKHAEGHAIHDDRDLRVLRMVVAEQRVLHSVRDFCHGVAGFARDVTAGGISSVLAARVSRIFEIDTQRTWFDRWRKERFPRFEHHKTPRTPSVRDESISPQVVLSAVTPAMWPSIYRLRTSSAGHQPTDHPEHHMAAACFSDGRVNNVAIFRDAHIIGWMTYKIETDETIQLGGIHIDLTQPQQDVVEIVLHKFLAALTQLQPDCSVVARVPRERLERVDLYLSRGFRLRHAPIQESTHWEMALCLASQ
ncbi:SET domain-containing protein [Sulfidibacter corallicola]|uniref:SET domain-containing protein n=1 Tax=Sulfidibacter corallicola TaxID=2818388 RepID=A0A8A4TGK0_SULCO|nr:SET domain-containing protein [Sulfidibacter corallicola]QTD48680.1 SET domain-containing protein [Sulfidibacter corallicola]